MSPSAAWRLETLGFTNVYEYLGGKADWFAAGLPTEGKLTSIPRAGDVARRDDVTRRPADRIGDVIDRVRAARKETCIVTISFPGSPPVRWRLRRWGGFNLNMQTRT